MLTIRVYIRRIYKESSEHNVAYMYISSPICTNRLIFGKWTFFILFSYCDVIQPASKLSGVFMKVKFKYLLNSFQLLTKLARQTMIVDQYPAFSLRTIVAGEKCNITGEYSKRGSSSE